MAPEGGQSRAGKWLEKEVAGDGRRPRKLELALALQHLFRLLKPEDSAESGNTLISQAEAAKRLHREGSSLSRYVNPQDPRVPTQAFIEDLHKAACMDAATSGGDVGITLEALRVLRTLADAETRGRCQRCAELGRRIDSLTRQVNTPCPSCAVYQREQDRNAVELQAMRGEVAAMRIAVQEREATEAGLRARLAMAIASKAPLPVPLRKGDRQRSAKERAVARQLAAQAGELDGAGKEDSALILLRHGTTELLNPSETALVMVELRQQERDHLADDLIHVYGRDQGDRDVMQVALELHAEGAVDDAGAILRAALR
ncbi:hypothetical protein [Streptomyces sp. NPDC050263]|uniref:hypothetical protein n=1 Tax=Streptomyces sp. NPDC050263 TaxID=3155037 RepID=UPI003421E8FA